MDYFQMIALFIVGFFYITYFIKALNLKNIGIKANRLGKGEKPEEVRRFERIALLFTYSMAVVQVGSILLPTVPLLFEIRYLRPTGLALAFIGVLFFTVSTITMKSNWRAGIDSSQKTELVTNGIYKISRNPAFVGFDLLYVGIAFCFSNLLNLVFAICGLLIFHRQILNEEKYLLSVFKQQYADYIRRVNRYITLSH